MSPYKYADELKNADSAFFFAGNVVYYYYRYITDI